MIIPNINIIVLKNIVNIFLLYIPYINDVKPYNIDIYDINDVILYNVPILIIF